MLENYESPWKYVIAALIFPIFFQVELWNFAWGVGDDMWLATIKRIFLLLPAMAIIFSSWAVVICALSIVVRSRRREFVSALFLTIWDMGRSLFFFWGGILKLALCLAGWIYGFVRLVVFGVLLMIKDIMLFPLRAFSEVSNSSFTVGIPWPAILMMAVWSVIEAVIFTFVMHPLVVEVLGGFSDGEFTGGMMLKSVLFVVFLFFVLGSYAVIHTLGEAIRERRYGQAIAYGLIEIIVAAVESGFFYREFVDALVPWFAQHAGEDFELGMATTLGIAFAVWFGIRCMTWFLFGASSIPMILAMIQRTGVDMREAGKANSGQLKNNTPMMLYVNTGIKTFRDEMDWVHSKSEDVLSAFLVPPSQILAACINFCTLLVSSNHLFSLPFRSYKDILDTNELLEKTRRTLRVKDDK